jgi:hypothetical protein
MTPWNRDISDSNFAIMPSSNFNEVPLIHINNMDDLYVLLGYTFKNKIFTLRFIKWNQVNELSLLRAYSIRKPKFTKFTFQRFPTISLHCIIFFERSFTIEPLSQTIYMNELHCTITSARMYQRVFLSILIT